MMADFLQFILADEIRPARDQSMRDIELATQRGTHYWIATAVYSISTRALLGAWEKTGEPMLMDKENLIEVMAGCYICEEPFAKRIADARCPGEPAQ